MIFREDNRALIRLNETNLANNITTNMYMRLLVFAVLYWGIYFVFINEGLADLSLTVIGIFVGSIVIGVLAFAVYYKNKYNTLLENIIPKFKKKLHTPILFATISEAEKNIGELSLPEERYLKYIAALFNQKLKEEEKANKEMEMEIDCLIQESDTE